MTAVLNVMTDAAWRLATTPSPSPSGVDANDVTPGVWGFVVTFVIAAAVVALIFDMQRRVRRVNYKAEIDERLQEELAAQSGQQSAPGQPATPRPQDGRSEPDDTTGDTTPR
ncbi:hypothetical protein [Mycetocola zhujimingii]|uniref:hypothetical protein n=1 Tax=Mycetocola zhujimingii TaxID=2079792 RepID=UPI0018E0A013|nr:hypothetical protein [Mycetocola zhujimingii]